MRKFYVFGTLVLALLFSNNSSGQDFSNKGKDFWVAYGYHQVMTPSGGPQEMVLYFAAEQVTNVTVTIPGNGYTASYVVPANSVVTSAPLPKNGAQDCRLTAESTVPENKGIHITSDKPIVAYAHIYNSSVSGASILFPTNTLGKEYYSVNFTNTSNSANSNCWAYVIAADPGVTTVEITPAANTINHPAGTTFTVSLNQGQVYNLMGQLTSNTNPFTGVDLSGTKIKSVASPSGACKRIAVFSGSGRISISCNAGSSSSDNYMVQDFPSTAWGKKFLTAPAAGNQSFNLFRVCVSDPTTVVKINGVVTALPLQNGFYYQIAQTNQPQLIEADKPVTVAQYFSSQGSCGNGNPGDPEIIYLSPVEQNISKVLWNATPNFAISNHYFNVVIPNTGTSISSFKLKNAAGTVLPVGAFTIHPQEPNYSYLRQALPSSGVYSIESDSGFNAIAYGFGSAESYGYNAGTNIKDIFQYVSVQNQYATVNFPATCRNTPFYFSMTFPYQPTTILWDFNGLFPNFSMPDPSLFFTGTIIVGGKTLYQYKIPAPYTIATAGTYPIKVTATNPTPDGCGGTQEIEYDVQVFNNPVADFNFTNTCFPDPIAFTDNSNTDGRPVVSRYWEFGDASLGNSNNPTHAYAVPGSYTVRYSLITDIGCIADTMSHVVTVSPLPTATMTGAIEVCKNAPAPDITFTGAVGQTPYTFTYTINGGPNQTVSTTGLNTSVTVSVPTTTAGTYTYNLVKVQDASPALCSQAQTGTVIVKVNELPTANIAGSTTVCKNAAVLPTITFTAAAGIAPYTFTYNINGGPNQTVTTVSGNSVTVSAPTSVAGTFAYNLVSVQDASTTLCSQAQTGTATVIINDLPTASISGTTEVCLNAASPSVSFTGAGTSGPYTFTYNVNGGPNQTITGNPVATIPIATTTAGTFIYNLVSVVDASSTLCSQAQTGTATVIVHPLPTPDFSVTTPTCETKVLTFTDISAPNAGAVNGWTWNFGDASPASNIQNPVHTYAAAGTYTVSLSVTTDKGCTSNPTLTRSVIVSPQPVTDFDLPEVCLSDTYAQFTDNSSVTPGSITNWLWNFGDPGSGPLNTSTIQNAQHSYTAVGNYTVTLTTTTDKGCVTTLSKPFVVNGDIPVSNFNALNPATMCANDSVAVQDASTVNFGSVTKVEIYWDNVGAPGVFDTDDTPTPGKIYKHKYPNFQSPLTKTFTIRYRAYSGGTCVNDRIKTITVNAAPKVQFLDMPDACLDAAPFQITQATETGAVPGSGIFSGPGVNATGIFNPALVGPGTYVIKYTYTATAAGCVDTLSKPITVLDSASAKFTYSALACQNTAVDFSSVSSTIPAGAGTITGWAWDFGDPASGAANTSALQNPSHVFSSWGTYNVKLVVITSNGCRSTVKTTPVFINPLPVPNFTIPASACLPSATVSFNSNISTIPDGSQASFTYLWNFDDPASGALNTSTNSSPSHIYNSAGPFNVNLQITSGAGCVQNKTIILNTIHPQPTGSFTANKLDVCVGQSFTFTDNSNPADGVTVSSSWDMGDGNTRTGSPLTYTYTTAGSFDVKLFITNSFGCRSSTAVKTVTVNPYPLVDAGPDLYILEDGSDTLQPVVTAINPAYLWTPNSYFLSSNAIKNPIVKGVDDITYTLTVTGQGDCIASDKVFIKVLKGPEIPNIFSPNGDGVNDKWIIKYLDTYPGGTVEIFNRYGQMIFHSTGYGTPWDGTIDGKPVPIGTYYYIVNPKNGRKIMSGYVDVIR